MIYANLRNFSVSIAVLPLFAYTLARCAFPSEKRVNIEYVTFMDFV